MKTTLAYFVQDIDGGLADDTIVHDTLEEAEGEAARRLGIDADDLSDSELCSYRGGSQYNHDGKTVAVFAA